MVKLLRHCEARSAEERAKTILKAFGYIGGAGGAVKACTP
jgi:hypothetical protein